jgi:glucose-6-phosphate isomerase
VNSFDQWGVEAGKTMAAQIKPALRGNQRATDPVTASLVEMQRGSPIPSEGH